jgi:membrane protease YdiL (CAAX protease family)
MDNARPPSFFWLGILVEGGLAVLALLLGWLFGLPPGEQWRWEAQDAALGVAACLPLFLVFGLCLYWPAAPLVRIRRLAEEFIRPLFAACTLPELALLALLAGVGEEMLFRGVLQEALGQWLGPYPGVALASLVFGVVHALTPTYAVLATLMGAYLGGLWLASGNLLVPVLAHGLYDFLALVYLVRSPPKKP